MNAGAAAELIAGGQKRVSGLLAAMTSSGRVPSAMLFTGPEGAGKEMLALELAAMLNCGEAGRCRPRVCPSCRKTFTLEHPDLHIVYPLPSGPVEKSMPVIMESRREDFFASGEFGGKSRSIGIDLIRRTIADVARHPFEGRYSAVLVFEAHLATTEAQNAFLKLLEEPPESAVIVLVTEFPDRLLPTIISRCQEVRFDSLPAETVASFMKTFYSIERQEAERIAASSGGNIRKAVRMLDARYLGLRRDAAGMIRLVLEGKAKKLPGEAESAAGEYSREEALQLFDEMAAVLRMLMRLRDGLLTGAEASLADKEIGKAAIAAASERDLPADIARITAASAALKRNTDIELAIVQLLLDLAGKWY